MTHPCVVRRAEESCDITDALLVSPIATNASSDASHKSWHMPTTFRILSSVFAQLCCDCNVQRADEMQIADYYHEISPITCV